MAIYSLASRAIASNLFFTNLRRLNSSPPMVTFATRDARSIHTRRPTDEEIVEYLELLERSEHPFIRQGPPSPFFGLGYGDKVYIRIDMPDVGKEGLKICQENNYYIFKGVESIDTDDDDEVEKRVYLTLTFVDPVFVVKDGIKAVIQNGVLRVVYSLRFPMAPVVDLGFSVE